MEQQNGKRKEQKKEWKVKVSPSFPRHPKLLRFAELLKPDLEKIANLEELAAMGILLKLWCATLLDEPDGVLRGRSPDMIRRFIGIEGIDGKDLLKKLTDKAITGDGFVNLEDGVHTVHDWKEEQGDIEEIRRKRRETSREWYTKKVKDKLPHEGLVANELVMGLVKASRHMDTPSDITKAKEIRELIRRKVDAEIIRNSFKDAMRQEWGFYDHMNKLRPKVEKDKGFEKKAGW